MASDHPSDLEANPPVASSATSATVPLPASTDPAAAAAAGDKPEPAADADIVGFDGPDDPLDPRTLSDARKWAVAAALSIITFTTVFASTIFSPATLATEASGAEFGYSNELMTLGTALFVIGFAVGPMLWGPMSERYGRRLPLFAGIAIFVICQVPVALATNVTTVMWFRFLGGCGAAAPQATAGGQFADIFSPVNTGLAMCMLSSTTLMGVVVGPVVGGFIVNSSLGWRWTAWATMLLAGVVGAISWFVVPESYAPVILTRKAQRARRETGNWALHSKLEEAPPGLAFFATKYLTRPWAMLALEPILALITAYMTLIYSFIHLLFEAMPFSFIAERGWAPGVGALPFAAIGLGVLLGAGLVIHVTNHLMRRNFQKNGYMTPEDRLIPMMFGSVCFPVGLFWFAWTSSPHLTPWPQIVAGVPIGLGILLIYMQSLAYLIDVYRIHANSALAVNTVVRSVGAAAFIMFGGPVLEAIDVAWSISIVGIVATLFMPVPFLFYRYGARIRKWSKWSATA